MKKQCWTLSHLKQVIWCTLTIFRFRVYPRGFNGVGVTKSLVFCVVFCRSLCGILTIVSSILWFIVSGWPIGIIKTFLKERKTITCTHSPVEFHKHNLNVIWITLFTYLLWTSFAFKLMILSYFVLKIETLLMYIDNFQDQSSFPILMVFVVLNL